MKKTFYGVWKGYETGVFDNWDQCLAATHKYKGAKFKKLEAKNKEDALKEFKQGYCDKKSSNVEEQGNLSEVSKKNKKKNNFEEIYTADVVYFCDGASKKKGKSGNGKSGSGVAIYFRKVLKKLFYGKYNEKGTNNSAELNGLLFCLKHIKENKINKHSIQIFIDSEYTINSITKWAYNWEKNNWRKRDNKQIENIELIKEIFYLYVDLKRNNYNIKIEKVKGHFGIEGNELADRMANEGIVHQEKEWSEEKNLNIEEIIKKTY